MGKSSSNDELTIRNQFDRICKLALKGEAADYYRHIAYRQKHEVLFSELSQKELDSIFWRRLSIQWKTSASGYLDMTLK